jgi:hypothetical protein
MALVNDIQALNPEYNKWYMDDGGIIGNVELLKKVWTCYSLEAPNLGSTSMLRNVNGHG